MKTEETITMYMNTHESRDNVVYTWLLWNFEKLGKIWNSEKLYCDHSLFKMVEEEAYKDKFILLITNNGKYRACEPNIIN